MKVTRYPSLTGLRAISIFIVLFDHVADQYSFFSDPDKLGVFQPFILFLKDGQIGVTVFFVISGFLITSLLINEEQEMLSISLKQFYLRRTLRIFPAYIFLLLVYFALQISGILNLSAGSWLTSITYTKYFNWQEDRVSAHFWSLSIEEQFYIFWPIIFTLGDRFRKSAAFLLILIVPVFRILIRLYSSDLSYFELTIFTRIDAIATGCIFALYKDKILEKISPYWNWVFICSVLILFFIRYIPVMAHLGFIFVPFGVTHGTIANVLIGLIMMYSVFGPEGIWFKFLNLRVIMFVGYLSYSLYLWQQLFIWQSPYWTNQFPQCLFFVVVSALISYYLIEKPFLRLKDRLNS